MKRKRIRWAASIYGRAVEELRETAKHILAEHLEEETTFRWPEGPKENIEQLEVREQYTEGGEGVFTDGRRLNGQTAAATITKATFLGRYATVMDSEMLAIAMGWI